MFAAILFRQFDVLLYATGLSAFAEIYQIVAARVVRRVQTNHQVINMMQRRQMPIDQVSVGVEGDGTETQASDVCEDLVDVSAHRRLAAGDIQTRRSPAQNLEHFNCFGRIQPLFGNVGVHVAGTVIAIGAAKVALHRDIKAGHHRLDELLVFPAGVTGL